MYVYTHTDRQTDSGPTTHAHANAHFKKTNDQVCAHTQTHVHTNAHNHTQLPTTQSVDPTTNYPISGQCYGANVSKGGSAGVPGGPLTSGDQRPCLIEASWRYDNPPPVRLNSAAVMVLIGTSAKKLMRLLSWWRRGWGMGGGSAC